MSPPQGLPEAADLLQRLLRHDTSNPPGHEEACQSELARWLEARGFTVEPLERTAGRPNLLTRLQGRGEAPPLLLYGHVDVVPADPALWRHPPFGGDLVDGWLWGRGALDMKGPVAVYAAALARARREGLRPAGDVLFAALADEEQGGEDGAAFLVRDHAQRFAGVRHALGEFGGVPRRIMDRTFVPIMVAEKGAVRIRATVRGPGGHAAHPVRGGATARLGRLLTTLDGFQFPIRLTPPAQGMIEALAAAAPEPAVFALRALLSPLAADGALDALGPLARQLRPLLRDTVAPTIVTGSTALNVIPTTCTVDLDCRTLPGTTAADLLNALRPALGDEVELAVLSEEPAPPAAQAPELFDLLADVIRRADPTAIPCPLLLSGCTDARHFARLGIQTYGFTPLPLPPDFEFASVVHAADERVPVDALEAATDRVVEVLRLYGKKV